MDQPDSSDVAVRGAINVVNDVNGPSSRGRRAALIGAAVAAFLTIAAGAFIGAALLLGPDEPDTDGPPATTNVADQSDPGPRLAEKAETDADPIELDGDLVHDDQGAYVVDETGDRTMILDHPVATVFDDRQGGLLYQLDRDGLESPLDELSLVTPSTEEQAVIWHLPAGATEPVVFRAADGPIEPRSIDETGVSLGLYDVGTNADGEPVVLYVEYTHVLDCSGLPVILDCPAMIERHTWVETLDHDRQEIRLGIDPVHLDDVQSPAQYDPRRLSVRDGIVAGITAYPYHDVWLTHGRVDDGRIDPVDDLVCDFWCAYGFRSLLDGDTWLFVPKDRFEPDERTEIGICPLTRDPTDCRMETVSLPDGELDVRMVGERGIIRNYRLERDFGVHALFELDDFYRIDLTPGAPEVLTKLDVDGTIVPLTAPLLRPTTTPVSPP